MMMNTEERGRGGTRLHPLRAPTPSATPHLICSSWNLLCTGLLPGGREEVARPRRADLISSFYIVDQRWASCPTCKRSLRVTRPIRAAPAAAPALINRIAPSIVPRYGTRMHASLHSKEICSDGCCRTSHLRAIAQPSGKEKQESSSVLRSAA